MHTKPKTVAALRGRRTLGGGKALALAKGFEALCSRCNCIFDASPLVASLSPAGLGSPRAVCRCGGANEFPDVLIGSGPKIKLQGAYFLACRLSECSRKWLFEEDWICVGCVEHGMSICESYDTVNKKKLWNTKSVSHARLPIICLI